MTLTPQRIVCLSAEAADWLWRIGAWNRVVGVTSYFAQPADAAPKPRVSGFSSANVEQITQLNPDLVISFSDVQAGVTGALVNRGVPVVATNQRSLASVEATLAFLARVVGCEAAGEELLFEFRRQLQPATTSGVRPRVYFEEWNDPLITGIAWVGELIERAGGENAFTELQDKRAASDRMVDPESVAQADPEIIFASWCGKPFVPKAIQARPGWEKVSAVREHRIYEIPAEDILQPGFRLVYGYDQIKRHLQALTCDAALSH
jgi:iron complex transport system substrate-binding protein